MRYLQRRCCTRHTVPHACRCTHVALAGEGEEEEGYGLDLDIPLETDAAPYIVLRLSDNEYTRSIYPHRFSLIYKVPAAAAHAGRHALRLPAAHAIGDMARAA
jgi:hypothetical protein